MTRIGLITLQLKIIYHTLYHHTSNDSRSTITGAHSHLCIGNDQLSSFISQSFFACTVHSFSFLCWWKMQNASIIFVHWSQTNSQCQCDQWEKWIESVLRISQFLRSFSHLRLLEIVQIKIGNCYFCCGFSMIQSCFLLPIDKQAIFYKQSQVIMQVSPFIRHHFESQWT